ncbi:MAG: T9SS type A sorting domain-containing protein [Bacteroidales bacterium]|nr:T9SS type A sorting domain-containing protein [Bacteroidales bacterium]
MTRADNPVSAGYEGASGTSQIISITGGIAFSDVNTLIYRDIWLSFGCKDATGDQFTIEYSSDAGTNWTKLNPSAEQIDVQAGSDGWNLITFKKSMPAVKSLAVRITTTATPKIDDIKISAEKDAGFDLRATISASNEIYNAAVEGKENGMFLAGSKATFKSAIDAAQAVADKEGYTNAEATEANTTLTAAKTAFEAKQIKAGQNAPKIAQAADQSESSSVQEVKVNLSGIGSSTGGGNLAVSATSKNGVAAPTVTYTSGATAVLTYKGTGTAFGEDRIIVKVSQANQPEGCITKDIEMSFAVNIYDASVNRPPVIDDVATQYIYNDKGTQNVKLTGVDAKNPDQVVTITAASDQPDVLANPTVTSVNAAGEATLSYTPIAGKSGKVKITLTVKDDANGTNKGEDTTIKEFYIVVYDVNNPPAMFEAPTDVNIVMYSGNYNVILSNMAQLDQIKTGYKVEVLEGADLISEPTIEYTSGQHFAILHVAEKGVAGTVKLRVFLDDYPQDVTLHIKPFSNPGIAMEFYDIVFWQQTNPIQTNASAVYSEVISPAHVPGESDKSFWGENYEKWQEIFPKITIAGNCDVCNPDPIIDMATSALKGFFVPQESGNYVFQFIANEAAGGVFLDTTCTSWKAAKPIATVTNSGSVGSNINGGKQSEPYYLEAGKVYPMYVERWFIHRLEYGLKVTGPGLSGDYLPAEFMAPLYDVVKPEAPQNVKIQTVMDKSLRIVWDEVSSGTKVAKVTGYNVYVNGVKNNTDVVTGVSYMAEGLTPATVYDVFVTAIDELGNESLISNVESATTYGSTTQKPMAPTGIQKVKATGETLKVKWATPVAPGSKVVAYDVYVDGELYNTDEKIFADTVFIRDLQPETAYKIQVVAYNASMVASDKSGEVNMSTGSFDPFDDAGLEFGEYRARLTVEKKNISWNWGMGINGDFKSGNLFKDQNFKKAIDNLYPGTIRWGALDANVYAFEKATGPDASKAPLSMGASVKTATHADNMNYANSINAYYSLCIGTKDGSGGLNGGDGSNYTVDYMSDPKTFLNLIEYLAGPMNSPYGRIRALEGYAEPLLTKEKSKGLVLEFGNEVWGGDAHNAPIGKNYITYGEWCRKMADTIKTSPYWNDIKDIVYMVYSARNPHPSDSYGLNEQVIKGSKGEVNTLGTAGYLGGNLDYNPEVSYGENIAQYYRLRQEHMKRNLEGLQVGMKNQIVEGGVPLYTYFYESQVSTSSYFGNLGQAVVLNDYLTASMKYGSIVPTIFTYGSGEWRISLDDGTPLAHYAMAALINKYCKGHVVSSTVGTNNTLMVENSKGTLVPLLDHDPVGASVYNNGKQWTIVLFSRDFQHDYSVQLALPAGINPKAGSVTRYRVTGDDPSSRETFKSDTLENQTITDGMIVKVPKYSMVMYTFEGDDPQFEALPLGYFDRVKGEKIELEGDLFIDRNKGNTKITPIVTPDNTFMPNVKWEILNAEQVKTHATITVNSSNVLTVRAAGTCNGIVMLKGYLADNPSVSVMAQVEVSNQTNAGDCYMQPWLDGVEDGETDAVKASVYPNPASDIIYVKTNVTDGDAVVNIYNASGVRVMSETTTSEELQMNVAGLASGYYYVTVVKDGKSETVPFMKK